MWKLKIPQWKTHTHTKILIIGLIWIGILVSFVTIGNVYDYRENADKIIIALTVGGAGMFLINIVRIIKTKKFDIKEEGK
jgi:prepilin signal peptidase PulO-like enzyme (type II secretory pathway)